MSERNEIKPDEDFAFSNGRTEWDLCLDTVEIPKNSRRIFSSSWFWDHDVGTSVYLSLSAYQVEGEWCIFQGITGEFPNGLRIENKYKILAIVKYAKYARQILDLYATAQWFEDWTSPWDKFYSSVTEKQIDGIKATDQAESRERFEQMLDRRSAKRTAEFEARQAEWAARAKKEQIEHEEFLAKMNATIEV